MPGIRNHLKIQTSMVWIRDLQTFLTALPLCESKTFTTRYLLPQYDKAQQQKMWMWLEMQTRIKILTECPCKPVLEAARDKAVAGRQKV